MAEPSASHISRKNRMRYVEIDFFRGIALIMMLISNFVTDLQYFAGYDQYQMFWRMFALLTASMFVFISGVSAWMSHFHASMSKFLKRFFRLFGLGLAITVFTKIFLEEGTIYFGVLHFLAIAGLLAIPFLKFGPYNLFLAIPFFAGKFLVEGLHSENLLLLPLGITPVPFFTFDYFPVFPWFGVFLLGVGTGAVFYPDGVRRFDFIFPENPVSGMVSALGRHTLEIYLIHQPVFASLLLLYLGNLPGVKIL
ncbi:DUF1624 domain-containing protein [Geoglobus acetivorans]|nr:DUF1624 domain-containing protein [Geoglobus acetivorans]